MRERMTDSVLSLMAAPFLSWLKRNGQELLGDAKEKFLSFFQALTVELDKGGLCVVLPKEDVESLLSMGALFSELDSSGGDATKTPFLWETTDGRKVRIYMQRFFACEVELAKRLALFYGASWDEERKSQLAFERAKAIGLFGEHPELCEIVFKQGLTVLYGGPGTGKTTQLTSILESLLASDPTMRILLAAPTGKASSRMKQTIANAIKADEGSAKKLFPYLANKYKQPGLLGLPSGTIHRWLFNVQESGERPSPERPLECDLFVVDETSMVDIDLARRLFSVLDPKKTRVILMGDAYQLQAVGPGSFFGDVCMFGSMAQHRFSYGLRKTYRFDPASPVGRLASKIKQEMAKTAVPDEQMAVARLPACSDPQSIARPLREIGKANPSGLLKEWLTPFIQSYARALRDGEAKAIWDTLSAFRMLSAMRQGTFGVERLNRIARTMLKAELGEGYTEDSGLPVIVLSNDVDRGVFNGDIGVILPKKSDDDSFSKVYFGDILDEQEAALIVPLGVLPPYEPAFAITVHKAQGSEFHHVALFLPEDSSNPLVTSELYYTGVTRVSDTKNKAFQIEEYGSLTVFATEEVEGKALTTCPNRTSGFSERLQEEFRKFQR